jgi:hypothetical protein
MQNHKMFLETLSALRRDLKEHPDFITREVGKNAGEFLSAYKSYSLFTNALKGFYSTLKMAQGQDDNIEAFFECINQLIASRQTASPTSGSGVLRH